MHHSESDMYNSGSLKSWVFSIKYLKKLGPEQQLDPYLYTL